MLTPAAVKMMRATFENSPAVQELCDSYLQLEEKVNAYGARIDDMHDTLEEAKSSLQALLVCLATVADAAGTIEFIDSVLELDREAA